MSKALDEARFSAGIMIFAYVLMRDHFHLITDSSRSSLEVLRFINGISAKRVVDLLKENGYESSLAKLRIQDRGTRHKYSLFEHYSNVFEIYGEETFIQKVNYIHLNPVRAELADHTNDCLFSSARIWHG